MINAIVFDLDGTLVDSELLQYKAYNHAFSQFGHPVSYDQWLEWSQNSYSAHKWIEKNRLPLDAELIRAEKKLIYDTLVTQELQLKEGVTELLEMLHITYPLAIASSSRRESIEACLEKFNLRDTFQYILSGVEMEKSKPHPDIYLKAALDMQQDPSHCLVIENSVSGIRAAKDAGMTCIACPDRFDDINHQTYKEADLVISSLAELTQDVLIQFDS